MTMTKDELFKVEVPQATESYAPVSHEQIITEVSEELDRAGLTVKNENYQIKRGGQRLIGMFDIETGSDEFNYRLAFRNSYDKSMSLAFVAGTSVIICSNGMVIGDSKFIRKHTGSVRSEMQERVRETIGDLDNVLKVVGVHSDKMKNIELGQREIAELCGRWFLEEEIIRSSQLNFIKDQLKKPDFEDFSDNSLWSLYNHATHALKKTAPEVYLDKYRDLHSFVEKEFQLS